MLIREGAVLVRNAADIIEAIGPIQTEIAPELPLAPPPKPAKSLREVAGLHSQILARLGQSPVAEDQLIRDLGVGSSTATPAIVSLELDGKITRHSGGLLSLNS